MKYIKLYWAFMILQFRTLTEYKTDFVIGFFTVILGQINTFLLTMVVFTQLNSLVGFSIYEIFLMYGFFIFIKGIDHFYNDNIWSFAWNKVKDGRFITILLRPINPIFYIVVERMEISGLSEAIIGLLIIIYSFIYLGIHLGLFQILVLCLLLLCGLSVFFSIKLLFSAPAFWTTCCGEFMTAGYEMGNTAKYPIELYKNKIIKSILLYIFPFPVAAYFPTVYCVNKLDHIRNLFGIDWLTIKHIVIYSVVVTGVLLFVSLKVWYTGLKHYQPTGT